jgi:hypothetical protein
MSWFNLTHPSGSWRSQRTVLRGWVRLTARAVFFALVIQFGLEVTPLYAANAPRRVVAYSGWGNSRGVCASCHETMFYLWAASAHSDTSKLAPLNGHHGAQCEDCHGPSLAHATYFDDPTLRPSRSTAATPCGVCHTGSDHPIYEEWQQSFHGRVTPEVADKFKKTPGSTLRACGVCHSGAVRLAIIKGHALPDAATAAAESVGCAVCHDPHRSTFNPAQLRYPEFSTNFYSYTGQFNNRIILCGQCHNARGSNWKDTAEQPHSPQYNMLLGNLGVISGPATNAYHGQIDRQCITCHVYSHRPTPAEVAVTGMGHTFWPQMENCQPCHTVDSANDLVSGIQVEFLQHFSDVQALLDAWATNKAPAALRQKYGTLAWEYTQPGWLSNPTGDDTIRGPTAKEQKQVPDEIKQARFDLYLVYQDKSLGVHNGAYARQLIQAATDKVRTLLNQP